MKVRIGVEADIPEMHRIRLAVRENRLLDPAMIQPEDYAPFLEERGRGWVAEANGRVVGFAIADLVRANIWALFVDPEQEGKGAGRALHSAMMDWMFAAGAERVWLSTGSGTRAESFYRSAGWHYTGDHHGEARYELARSEWLSR